MQEGQGFVKDEAKELAKGWGVWILVGLFTIDDRRNRDLSDTISLIIFGTFTLVLICGTFRFLYRLVTSGRRAPKGPTG